MRFRGAISSEFARLRDWEGEGGVSSNNMEVDEQLTAFFIVVNKAQSRSVRMRKQSARSSSGLASSNEHHHDMRTTKVCIPVGPPNRTSGSPPEPQISDHH